MRKILLLCIGLIPYLYSSGQNRFQTKQINSDNQIEIRYDSINGVIRGIAIPVEFEIIFNPDDSLWISGAHHYSTSFDSTRKWKTVLLRTKVNDKFITQHSMKLPQQPDSCQYWVGVVCNINPESDLQDSLSAYTERMKNEGLSSLSVGTLQEFKNNHPALVDRLLKNDSIGFDVRRAPRKFVEFISFSVEY